VESKIAVLENEVNQMRGLFSKLDESIDKMAEISGAIQQMLAVHETQIQSQAQDTEDLFHLVEKRRIENDENLKELHSRITTNGKETRKEMNENVIKIMNAIEDVKDLMVDRERIINEQQAQLEERINSLEKKSYFMMGGAAIIGFLVGAYDWIAEIFS
tara:strand:+ start:2623 stop:3099 length:477 start_codon:yes stop_codon:yes gene_type:complete